MMKNLLGQDTKIKEIRDLLTKEDKERLGELDNLTLSIQPDGIGCYYGNATTKKGNRVAVNVALPNSPLNKQNDEYLLIVDLDD